MVGDSSTVTARPSQRPREVSANLFDWILLAPAVLILTALTLFPVAYNVFLSLYQKHAYLPEGHFVGLGNFATLLRDPEFLNSFWNGTLYAIGSIAMQLLLGTAAAVMLNCRFRGQEVLRGVLLFPYLIPTIVVVLLWKWLLNGSYGLLNYLLVSSGVALTPIAWFSRDHIMLTLILVSTWQFFPFVVVSVLARLQAIPEDLYRAARIDNATHWATFIHITLPELRNVLVTVTLLRSIWMFTKFDTVWLLAGREGVGKYIQTVPVYAYRVTFEYLQAGMGAAISVVLLVFLVVGSVGYLFLFARPKVAR